MFGNNSFRWGERPPKWLMKQFAIAIEQMGKKSEVAHVFDVGPKWSFIIMIAPSHKVEELAPKIRAAYEQLNEGPQ